MIVLQIFHKLGCHIGSSMSTRSYLCVLLCMGLAANALAQVVEDDAGEVWGVLDSFPEDIDVVAVFENPAEHLLTEHGQASRSFIGSVGLFGKTRRAWGALGALFETDADGVVELLMSGRVVVLGDSLFGRSVNPFMMIHNADTNWVVMAEVDAGSIAGLRRQLKPVPREIVEGVPVYAIEQGRYALVMLGSKDDGGGGGGRGRVMLAPKSARGLLERAIGVVKGGLKNEDGGIKPTWEGDHQWSVAVRVRVDDWVDWSGDDQLVHVRAIAGGSMDGYEVSLSMPYGGEIRRGRAPVGILGSLDDDTVLAVAISSVVELSIEEDSGVSFRFRDGDEEVEDGGASVLRPEGSLIVMSKKDVVGLDQGGEASGVTVMAMFAVDQEEVNARWMDGLIEPMLMKNHDDSDGVQRSYDGLFPRAIRTHTVHGSDGKPTNVTNVSWKTTRRTRSSDLIFSLGSEFIDTAPRVQMLDRVAGAFDALPDDPMGTSVLMSGFIRVRSMIESFTSIQGLVSQDELAGISNRMTWQIRYDGGDGGEGALRARVYIDKGRGGAESGVGSR